MDKEVYDIASALAKVEAKIRVSSYELDDILIEGELTEEGRTKILDLFYDSNALLNKVRKFMSEEGI